MFICVCIDRNGNDENEKTIEIRGVSITLRCELVYKTSVKKKLSVDFAILRERGDCDICF